MFVFELHEVVSNIQAIKSFPSSLWNTWEEFELEESGIISSGNNSHGKNLKNSSFPRQLFPLDQSLLAGKESALTIDWKKTHIIFCSKSIQKISINAADDGLKEESPLFHLPISLLCYPLGVVRPISRISSLFNPLFSPLISNCLHSSAPPSISYPLLEGAQKQSFLSPKQAALSSSSFPAGFYPHILFCARFYFSCLTNPFKCWESGIAFSLPTFNLLLCTFSWGETETVSSL